MTPAARAALLLAGTLMLGGCALLQPERSTITEPPLQPVVQLEIDAPEALATLLRTHLDIARFQQMPEAEAIGSVEIDRLVGATPVQARALLETEGYFAATVTARREPGDGLPLVRVTVVPGPPTLVSAVQLDVVGDLQTALAAGATHAADTLAGLRRDWSLQPGARFRQSDWTDAKNSALAALRADAYPAAAWQETQARVEVASHTAGLRAMAISGPRFLLGPIRVEGLEHHDASSVQRLATFDTGQPATERTLLDFQLRVQKLGLFETVQVELDNDPERALAAPVTVRVREQPLQQATVGVGITANTGPRVTLEHVHRRPFDVPWVAQNKIELGGTRRSWELDLVSHPLPGLYRNLLSGNIERLATGEEVRTTADARIGRAQDMVRIERLYFAEFVTERLVNPAGATRSDALSANYHWIFRDLDSIALPTDGQALSAKVAAGQAQSTTQDSGPFGRLESKLSLWRPIGDSWYATARVELGQVFAADNVGIPDSLLFRAGGDESVRGYAYRSLGPTRDGVLVSGRALATGSIELARPVSAKLPSVWGAVFLDAGNAADNFGDLRPVAGYGVGVRWRSPVGPLRVDLAYGHELEKLRLHLSVGIAF